MRLYKNSTQTGLILINVLLVLSLFISINFLSIVIGFYIGISLMLFLRDSIELKIFFFKSKKDFLILFLPLAVVIISIIWTENLARGLDQIFKRLPLILLPFSLWVQRFYLDHRIKELITKFFILLSALLACYAYINIYLFYPINYETHLTFIHIRYLLENHILFIHPVYLGLFWGLASILAFYILVNKQKKTILFNSLVILLFLINLSAILFISARMSILAVLICLILLLIYFEWFKIILIVSILSFCSVFIIQKHLPGYRFSEILDVFSESSLQSLNKKSTLHTRVQIYLCTSELIKSSPILGYGIGDIQNKMFLCTRDELGDFKYNSHNQYFEYLLSSGVLGLCVFIFFLIKTGKKLYLKNTKIGMVVFIFFVLSFLTENLFARTRGVFIFTYFVYLNYFFYDETKTTNNNY